MRLQVGLSQLLGVGLVGCLYGGCSFPGEYRLPAFPHDLFAQLDANGDGQLSLGEAQRLAWEDYVCGSCGTAGIQTVEAFVDHGAPGGDGFAAADQNHDGFLSYAELNAYYLASSHDRAALEPPQPSVASFDCNHDGFVSAEELMRPGSVDSGPLPALFIASDTFDKQLHAFSDAERTAADTNHDGRLSVDELTAFLAPLGWKWSGTPSCSATATGAATDAAASASN